MQMQELYMVHDDTEYAELKEKLSPDEYKEYMEIMQNAPKTIKRDNATLQESIADLLSKNETKI